MSGFTLQLASATRQMRLDNVLSFVGTDASGQFGLMAGHVAMATVLDPGLARFRSAAGAWRYLALPGGTLRFADNVLMIATRSFVVGDELSTVRAQLDAELEREEEQRGALRHNLDQLEKTLAHRLWKLDQP
ncbi:F0F1 ATP synthase subunit epsilon [Azoarcus sp. L1K30]|uniref:F0F1 ATP synthase subunit epsilon n=1 Tax=Azoarcus sp. L1K30 TaxID=2820277 RepID=UPI001B81EE0B|nr:F0F1 ATP synthase subunit epsilon [Azoarcus sp. L1K30]MBR0565896.1 F0F1 ATP synthase subunit epsilon [Azoarcus sp. L1K30]